MLRLEVDMYYKMDRMHIIDRLEILYQRMIVLKVAALANHMRLQLSSINQAHS